MLSVWIQKKWYSLRAWWFKMFELRIVQAICFLWGFIYRSQVDMWALGKESDPVAMHMWRNMWHDCEARTTLVFILILQWEARKLSRYTASILAVGGWVSWLHQEFFDGTHFYAVFTAGATAAIVMELLKWHFCKKAQVAKVFFPTGISTGPE